MGPVCGAVILARGWLYGIDQLDLSDFGGEGMSQRRQAAEMALRSAMKSGKSPLHISHSVSRPKVSKGYETVAHVQINTGMLSIASAA